MITTFQFARMLSSALRDATKVLDWEYAPCYRINGRLDTEVLLATVEIHVWEDFSMLRQVPPRVWCHESWMRQGAEWHNCKATGMCWVLQNIWRDAMSWKGKRTRDILEEGQEWFLNDVRCLINRHYTAYLEGLAHWPKEWAFWAHNSEGAKDYETETRRVRCLGSRVNHNRTEDSHERTI